MNTYLYYIMVEGKTSFLRNKLTVVYRQAANRILMRSSVHCDPLFLYKDNKWPSEYLESFCIMIKSSSDCEKFPLIGYWGAICIGHGRHAEQHATCLLLQCWKAYWAACSVSTVAVLDCILSSMQRVYCCSAGRHLETFSYCLISID